GFPRRGSRRQWAFTRKMRRIRLLGFGGLWLLVLLAIAGLSGGCRKARDENAPRAEIVRTDGPLEVKAATFNIRNDLNQDDTKTRAWINRVPSAVRLIRKMAPDVMGMQELTHGQAADLRASLPDYGFFGKAREDGDRKGEYAGIFYREDRFAADRSDGGTFWFSDTPEKPGSMTWGNTFPRVATWIRLIDRSTGRGFYVFNTHFDHRHQGSREKAAILLAQRIDGRKNGDEPVVLLGDFNAVESNPAVAYLAGKSGMVAGTQRQWSHSLVDTFQLTHPAERNRRTLHLWTGSHEGGLKVDHILVSKGAQVVETDIVADVAPFASDHFPVTARVIFR
ncbi:MAG: endonuclease/exonuclease/phosphatase family protein, partial [Verrucomicrobiaceae bacterium]